MIERLLLDRVDTKTGTSPISTEDHFPAPIFPDEAKPFVTLFELAISGTQLTFDSICRSLSCRRLPRSRFGPPIPQNASVRQSLSVHKCFFVNSLGFLRTKVSTSSRMLGKMNCGRLPSIVRFSCPNCGVFCPVFRLIFASDPFPCPR